MSDTMKLYKSIKTIPIARYYEVTNGNLAALNRDIEIDEVVEITSEYKDAYEKLILSHIEMDLTLQNKLYNVYNSYFDIDENNTKTQRGYFKNFSLYLDELDKRYKDFEYKGEIYKSARQMYNSLRAGLQNQEAINKFEYEDKMFIFAYHNLKCKPLSKWDLYDDLVFINKVLGINLDENTTTAQKFFSVKNRAIKVQKENSKK